MRKKIRWITGTGAMLALLICLQWAGSMIPEQTIKQLVTGSCVNACLAVAALYLGSGSGVALALVSPVCAFLLGIAPNFITVVPIMVGNTAYVLLLRLLFGKGKPAWRQPVAVMAAAAAKFGILYILVVQVVCNLASGALLGKKLGDIVVLAPPMLQMLPAMFTWPQLITALIGGSLALAIVPAVKKAIPNQAREDR